MASGRPDAERADILIDGDRILAVGEGLDEIDADVVDFADRIIVPGFVNAHLHTWQTGLRGVGADWSLLEYLTRTHGDIARHYRPADIHIGTLAGALNQIDSGVTTLGDWCHNCRTPEHADAAIEALLQAGIRAVFLHGTSHGGPGKPHNAGEVDRLLDGPIARSSLLTLGMAIKGPQLSPTEVALSDLRAGAERGVLVSMHQSAGRPGPGWQLASAAGLWGPRTNVVHGTGITGDLLKTLVDAGVSFTSTPENELAQGHCTTVIEELRGLDSAASLGTDTETAVAGDILTSARIALARQRALVHDDARRGTGLGAPDIHVTSKHALEWITTEGARALGLDDQIGRIQPGMQADLVVIDARALNLRPAHNPIAAVLHANTANIEAVMVAGQWRKRDHALTDPSIPAIASQLEQSGERLVRAAQSSGVLAQTRRHIVRRVVHRALREQTRHN